MFRLSLVLALVVLASASNFQAEFNAFKSEHNKLYAHPKEEALRYQVFAQNLEKVNAHNARADAGLESYWMGVNQFTDLTYEEFAEKYLGVRNSTERSRAPLLHNDDSIADLPESVDWRTKGIVTEVKNQKSCGSCWSFSTTASIEGAWAQAKGELVSLSEQNLMDCSWKYGNRACKGGLMDNAFEYVIKNGGIDTEESYPYREVASQQCRFTKDNVGATISSFVDVPKNEKALKNAVSQRVVSVAIHAGDELKHYKNGVFDSNKCRRQLNHAITAVGYDSEAWIIRNSWGTSWGEEGYVRFKSGKNLCGVANAASYPIV